MADVALADLVAAQSAIITPGTTYYLILCTADPGSTGTDQGAGLTPQAIVFGTPTTATPSVQSSTTSQSFTDVPGSATYTSFAVLTAASDGTYVRGGTLTASITPPAGSTVTVATGAITFDAS